MHSLISEHDESHKQQAGRNDASSERWIGSRRDVFRFRAIHQN
jgi:hypothetical protein